MLLDVIVSVLIRALANLSGRPICAVGQDIRLLDRNKYPEDANRPSEASKFKGLAVGQKAITERLFSDRDLAEYVDLTGDRNPLFGDDTYARQAGLEGPMVPGGLLGGLFSYLLGTELPGRGTNWLKQRLVFLRPAYPGDRTTARVEIIRLRPEKELVNLRTQCLNPTGQVICTGEALVLVSDLESAS